MTFIKTSHIVFFISTVILISIVLRNTNKKTKSYVSINKQMHLDTVLTGKQLANIYCKVCHEFPEPKLLDKSTWVNNVLPNMGLRMGIKIPGVDAFAGTPKEDINIVKSLNIYPEEPILTKSQWSKIIEYYEREAPIHPIDKELETPIINKLPQFKADKIFVNNKGFPRTSLLKFDELTSQLYVGDASNLIYILDKKMKLKRTLKGPSPAVDIDFPTNKAPRILTIGKFSPSDQNLGELSSMFSTDNSPRIKIQNLPRPVNFSTADLNADEKEDVIICGFGHNRGKLLWYDNFDPNKRYVIKNAPGARKTEVFDFNNDGKPDIMALMAQANEQISIFYNRGNNKFEEKIVLKFPPVYGVSYFELADFNNDGYKDILLSNGDNWDYSVIRKNYHGVRVYLNDGHDNFEKAFFYPLYGASKAMARDFDNDGFLDIAASAFYYDDDKPEQSFIYLSNNGNMTFKTFSTPEAASGKWLTMDVADYDGDGDIDIFLGSYFHTFGEYFKQVSKGVSEFPQLLVLTNNQE